MRESQCAKLNMWFSVRDSHCASLIAQISIYGSQYANLIAQISIRDSQYKTFNVGFSKRDSTAELRRHRWWRPKETISMGLKRPEWDDQVAIVRVYHWALALKAGFCPWLHDYFFIGVGGCELSCSMGKIPRTGETENWRWEGEGKRLVIFHSWKVLILKWISTRCCFQDIFYDF